MSCTVLELRQYTLRPGRRDDLIELFDREFVESQEALGMQIVGQFRDVDRPERFVWLRGYADLAVRREALPAFYSGPVWRAHSEAANATMVAVDDVLLLRPTASGAFPDLRDRPAIGATGAGHGFVTATIHPLRTGASAAADAAFTKWNPPAPDLVGDRPARIVGSFVTDPSENSFPALPVREDDTVLVWFAAHPAGLADLEPVARQVTEALGELQVGDPEIVRLAPTARSRLDGTA